MDAFVNLLTRILDYPLDWLLYLPRDVMIVLIALGTSLMMTLARKWTTDQELLHRCHNDLIRLGELLHGAKKSKDKPSAKRFRSTMGMIKLVQFKAEMRAMAFSIIPVALLATWAFERVPYVPPRVNQPMTVKAYFPLSCADHLAHMNRSNGLQIAEPIQLISRDPGGGQNALAVWTVQPTERLNNGDLCFRYEDETVHQPCKVGGIIYDPPVLQHPDSTILCTETVLNQPKFLGILPGISFIGFDSWLLAYLILAFIFVPLSRKVLKIY